VALDDDLGLAGTKSGTVLARTRSTLAPRSRPANWYSDSVSGTGVTRQYGAGIGAQDGAGGQGVGLAGAFSADGAAPRRDGPASA